MKNLSVAYLIFILAFFNLDAKDCVPVSVSELILNGNFEQGDTNFLTDYSYSKSGRKEKTYSVVSNPNQSYFGFDSCADHTGNNGNMMVVNGDSTSGSIVWGQTIKNINTNTAYEFSFWHTSVNNLKPAVLFVVINDDTLSPFPVIIQDSSCHWQRATFVWNSSLSDSAVIKIYDLATHVAGNDFALDDLSFILYCRIQACTGKNLYICKNNPVQLSGSAIDGYEPYAYKWFPQIGLNNPDIQNPVAVIDRTTTYFFTATDINGCSSTDSVIVNVIELPDNQVTTDKPVPLCPCDFAVLTAKPGLSYLWSTGEKTQQIRVYEPGDYSVELTNLSGCVSYGNLIVSQLPVSVELSIDSVTVKGGSAVELKLNLIRETNLINCGYTNYKAGISYNSSVLLPEKTDDIIKTGSTETIILSGNVPDSINNKLNFTALLGNKICTDITLDEINFGCDSVHVTYHPGSVCLSDICYEGGPRLMDMNDNLYLKHYLTEGDALHLDFGVIESGQTNIAIYNYCGQYCDMAFEGLIKPGIYSKDFDLRGLADGIYFLVLQSNGMTFTSAFIK